MADWGSHLPIAQAVYLLCAATSIACALLLYRGFKRTGARLLLWSGLCFVGLAINNALLFVDRALFPGTPLNFMMDMSIWRGLAALTGLMLLIFGLIWDAD